ncbi:N-acetyltransferase 16, like isoform X2 [Engraulis encrasicolus]|uniref:N-acetyltransferase 16, like isoform X2 n=1 Tax=Engraulis encrasicolus TaxID=184585 RepID=UPI002FD6E3CA
MGVALESGVLVDGGRTVVVEGLRVCPTERGRGVAGTIQGFADSYLKKLYPSIQVKRMTRGDDPGPEKLSKFKLLARRAVLSLLGEAEDFDGFTEALKARLMSENAGGGAVHLPLQTEDKQLRTILLQPDLAQRLQLPGGSIIQDWQPLEPIESNLAVLRRRNLTWFVAAGSGGSPDNNRPAFLSFYTPPYPVPYGFRLNIDLYGTDPSLARGALVANLDRVRAQLRGKVAMHLYMHQAVAESLKEFCQTQSSVQWGQWRSIWEQLFLERDF